LAFRSRRAEEWRGQNTAEDVTLSERTGTVWLATGKKIIVLQPTGEVLAEYPIVSPGVLSIAAP